MSEFQATFPSILQFSMKVLIFKDTKSKKAQEQLDESETCSTLVPSEIGKNISGLTSTNIDMVLILFFFSFFNAMPFLNLEIP